MSGLFQGHFKHGIGHLARHVAHHRIFAGEIASRMRQHYPIASMRLISGTIGAAPSAAYRASSLR